MNPWQVQHHQFLIDDLNDPSPSHFEQTQKQKEIQPQAAKTSFQSKFERDEPQHMNSMQIYTRHENKQFLHKSHSSDMTRL